MVLKVINLVQLDVATQALSKTSINSRLAFKNTRASRFWGDRLAFLLLQVFPAKEKTRSLGADVAGLATYYLAKRDNDLNLCSCSFHQLSGFESMAFCGSDVNTANCRLIARGVSSSESDIAGISVSLSSSR